MLSGWCTAAVIGGLVLSSGQTSAPDSAAASAQEVNPYELRENGVRVNGAIYTPFIRQAMAVRVKDRRGRTLGRSDPLTDAAVYIVFRWSQADQDRARQLSGDDPLQLRVGIMPDVFPPVKPGLIEPLWTTQDLTVLEDFGAPVPFPDAAIIAAFPRQALTPGAFVMAYVRHQDLEGRLQIGPHSSVRGASITTADLTAWK
jgi:class 3 adenylate cyclase